MPDDPTRTHPQSIPAPGPPTTATHSPSPGTQTAPGDPLTASGGETPFDHPCGTASEAAGGVLAGRYRLREPLGEGGMGSVWLADQLAPVRREVAVKVIKRGLDSARVLARFEAERQALALMDHPHIARVLDGGATDRGQPFFVMEVVRGDTLTGFCDARRLGLRERLDLFAHICSAVQHAHQKGVIHRDLKPSNILVAEVDGRPVPKVIDFGLAKAVGGDPLADRSAATAVGTVLGTPPYMAPEQATPGAVDVDTRADVYALGAVLYELLTGTTPIAKERFARLPLDEAMRLVREEEPPTPSRRLSDTKSDERAGPAAPVVAPRVRHAADLDWVVMKAIAKERERRYESASGLAADVRRFLADEPVQARPPTAGYRVRKFVRRNRRAVLAGGLVLAAVVAGVSGTALALVEARRQRDDANDARGREETQRVEAEKQAAEATTQRDRAVKAEAEATARLAEVSAEKKRTDEQRRVAAALNDFFLKAVVGQTAVETQLEWRTTVSPNLTLREAVDRAAGRLDGRFPDQPLVEAAIRFAVGEAYLHLGVPGKTVAHAERCIALRAAALGPADLATVAAEGLLLSALVQDHQHRRAIPLARRVCDRLEADLGRGDPQTLQEYRTLAMAYLDGGQTGEAAAVLGENLTLAGRTLARDAEETLKTIDALARVRLAEGKPELAEKLYADAVGRWEGEAATPGRLVCVGGLAVALFRKGRPAEAEPHARAALAMSTALYGEYHPNTWAVQNTLAVIYRRSGRAKDAVPLLRGVHANMAARLGPDNLDSVRVLNNLAVACEEAGDRTAALDLSERAYRTVVGRYTADHPTALEIANSLGNMRCKFGDPAAGLALLHDTLARRRKVFPESHPAVDETFHAVVDALIGHGRRGEVRRVALDRVTAARKQLKPEDDKAWLPLLSTAGYMLLDCDAAADAEPLLRDALTRSERTTAGRWPAEVVRAHLGRALLAQGKFAAAEPELVRATEKLTEAAAQLPAGVRPIAAECGPRLVELYERWGKPEEAKAWRRKIGWPEYERLPPPRADR